MLHCRGACPWPLQERERKRQAAAKRSQDEAAAVRARVSERQRDIDRHLEEQRMEEERRLRKAAEAKEQLKVKEVGLAWVQRWSEAVQRGNEGAKAQREVKEVGLAGRRGWSEGSYECKGAALSQGGGVSVVQVWSVHLLAGRGRHGQCPLLFMAIMLRWNLIHGLYQQPTDRLCRSPSAGCVRTSPCIWLLIRIRQVQRERVATAGVSEGVEGREQEERGDVSTNGGRRDSWG